MKIETDTYQVANIAENNQALHVIKHAESKIANLIGNNITLIAYMKTDELSPEKADRLP